MLAPCGMAAHDPRRACGLGRPLSPDLSVVPDGSRVRGLSNLTFSLSRCTWVEIIRTRIPRGTVDGDACCLSALPDRLPRRDGPDKPAEEKFDAVDRRGGGGCK